MKPQPIADYILTAHSRYELSRRGLSEDIVRAILAAPEQGFELRPGRIVLQSKISFDQQAKMFLVRVVVDIDRVPAEVITAYRTSKIAKYWREGS